MKIHASKHSRRRTEDILYLDLCIVRQQADLQHLGLWIQHNVALSKEADVNHLLLQGLAVPLQLSLQFP